MASRIARNIVKSVRSRAQMDGDGAKGILLYVFKTLQATKYHYSQKYTVVLVPPLFII